MALTLAAETTRTIALEDYIEYVAREVDGRDEGSILASAVMLRALANDPGFVTQFLNRQLADLDGFQRDNRYTGQSFMLLQGPQFGLRVNVWEPPPPDPAHRDWHSQFHYYLVPHDHTFSFLTVGLLGPGYETTIYECDDHAVHLPGTPANIRFSEHTSLPAGKVMFYRAGRDIHRQEHAPAFSLSLNLMLVPPEEAPRQQHYFDLERGQVIRFGPGGDSGTRELLCRVAGQVGDGVTQGHLDRLAASHPGHRERLQALQALCRLAPRRAEALWTGATADVHPHVRRVARRALQADSGLLPEDRTT